MCRVQADGADTCAGVVGHGYVVLFLHEPQFFQYYLVCLPIYGRSPKTQHKCACGKLRMHACTPLSISMDSGWLWDGIFTAYRRNEAFMNSHSSTVADPVNEKWAFRFREIFDDAYE